MNVSKGQAYTTAKKHTNKPKRANTNWCDRPILQPKQAITNPSKKNYKKFDNHHKTSCCCQKDVCQKLGSQQQAKYDKENCRKPARHNKEIMRKAKSVKVRNWAGKITQAVHESTAKNKATK